MTVVKVYVNAKVETSIVELETEFVDKLPSKTSLIYSDVTANLF